MVKDDCDAEMIDAFGSLTTPQYKAIGTSI